MYPKRKKKEERKQGANEPPAIFPPLLSEMYDINKLVTLPLTGQKGNQIQQAQGFSFILMTKLKDVSPFGIKIKCEFCNSYER